MRNIYFPTPCSTGQDVHLVEEICYLSNTQSNFPAVGKAALETTDQHQNSMEFQPRACEIKASGNMTYRQYHCCGFADQVLSVGQTLFSQES